VNRLDDFGRDRLVEKAIPGAMTARACASVNSWPRDRAAASSAAASINFIETARFFAASTISSPLPRDETALLRARRELGGLRLHVRSGTSAQIRRKSSVIGGDHVPGRLRLPRRVGQFRAEGCRRWSALRGGQKLSLRHRKSWAKFSGHPSSSSSGTRPRPAATRHLREPAEFLCRAPRPPRPHPERTPPHRRGRRLLVVAAFADHGNRRTNGRQE